MPKIKIGNKISDLTGNGVEWLVVDGYVVAKFINGFLVTENLIIGNSDVTCIQARPTEEDCKAMDAFTKYIENEEAA